MKSILIRALTKTDLPAVSDLIHASFGAALRPFMTYTQHGIGAFLSVHVQYPGSDPGRYLLVAVDEAKQQDVVGFAEFRIIGGNVGFLSYVCITESARGRGIARAFLESFVEDRPELDQLQLDVFQDNAPAVSLYRKLGFTPTSTVAWVSRSMPAPVGAARIRTLPTALANLSTYGFCEMEVMNETSVTRIGLVGQTVLRCFSAQAFDDDALLSSLRRHFPLVETALVILPTEHIAGISSVHQVVKLSDRMKLSL
ncbi:N-acetyltransferase [Pseudarthrobacter sp. H3Y2-7]|uniref:GNAT family N-acetyltransferase n=1 Tax=Pseudarthrobacter naphthalenicus TaxID=3031328 RepID=UPI0023AE8BE8|nr:N-acetyltransferase [Pseudarthrobacter sp. H3Y2-7]MDE8668153.1 N-acetyltransferase [Pseudarthrobacter sp. H3Y2-7]